MKKYFMLVVVLVAVMVLFSCFAQITDADLNIGGIYYDHPVEDVIKISEEPVRRERIPPAGGSASVLRFGYSEISVSGRDTVRSVFVLSGNDFSTAAGIGIGSTYLDCL